MYRTFGEVSRRLDGALLGEPLEESCRSGPDKSKRRAEARKSGPSGPAKILPMEQVPQAMTWLARLPRESEVAQLMFSFSYYAGMRTCEMAGITWRDVTDASGNIASVIHIPAEIAKYDRSRDIPMHPRIAIALEAFSRRFPEATYFALNPEGEPRSVNALTVWFHRIYKKMGLPDCSSHSGRRSFLTYLANNHGRLGMSLRDVQLIAGHASLETTQRYIQPSADLHRLVASVPWLPEQLEVPSPAQWPLQERTAPPSSAYAWGAGFPGAPATAGPFGGVQS